MNLPKFTNKQMFYLKTLVPIGFSISFATSVIILYHEYQILKRAKHKRDEVAGL